MPEELCPSYASNLWNVKTGQNNLWIGQAQSNIVSQRTVCKDNTKADIKVTGLVAPGLKIKSIL